MLRYYAGMRLLSILTACLLAAPAFAHDPEILGVSVEKVSGKHRFDVTILHPDTGWDHYADGWEVLDAAGKRLAYRLLHHPHVNEQPFTRSLSVDLPEGTREIFIRAHCSVDGWNKDTYRVTLEP